MQRIAGKRAVVSGAGSGIGRATAIRFAREGARVGVLDRDDAAVTRVVDEIATLGGTAVGLPCDVTVEDDVAAAMSRASDLWGGGLDVVVANAGVQLFGQDAAAHLLDVEVFDRTHAVNLRGAFLVCKHGLRAMLRAGGGSLILTGSPTGLFGGGRGFTAYSSSKAGVVGLARVIAADYADQNIRSNVVVPGFTSTPLVAPITASESRSADLLATVPLGRPGTPDDVASMMLFLASDESAYATGALFTVDGGQTAV
jgi:NAD(P)-dependent dehydrogenase (short-subunit alcohol dehydrogenase family)